MRIVIGNWELMKEEGHVYMRDLTGALPTEVFPVDGFTDALREMRMRLLGH